MTSLPESVLPYRTIGPFTHATVPAGLLKQHNTKPGVWGLLEVVEGEIRYVITQSGQEEAAVLSAAASGVIVPEQSHHLEVTGPVTFQITFLKTP